MGLTKKLDCLSLSSSPIPPNRNPVTVSSSAMTDISLPMAILKFSKNYFCFSRDPSSWGVLKEIELFYSKSHHYESSFIMSKWSMSRSPFCHCRFLFHFTKVWFSKTTRCRRLTTTFSFLIILLYIPKNGWFKNFLPKIQKIEFQKCSKIERPIMVKEFLAPKRKNKGEAGFWKFCWGAWRP